MSKIIHIVEHYPKGTIFRLINPLSNFENQSIIYTPEDFCIFNDLLKKYNKGDIFVLHTSGRYTEMLCRLTELTTKYNVFLFLHVSPEYMYFQKRYESLEIMRNYYEQGVRFLTPCIAIKDQLLVLGIESNLIQIGIQKLKIKNKYNYLNKYLGKIITCCTANTDEYRSVKGIQKFISFVKENNLEEMALIVGYNEFSNGVQSITLTHDEFIYVLSHSLMYIQFSKYEAYNITAIEAKQLKIPVIVLNVEGIKDNVLYGYALENEKKMFDLIISILYGEIDKDIIEQNYEDSICRESLNNFAAEFYRLQKGLL